MTETLKHDDERHRLRAEIERLGTAITIARRIGDHRRKAQLIRQVEATSLELENLRDRDNLRARG